MRRMIYSSLSKPSLARKTERTLFSNLGRRTAALNLQPVVCYCGVILDDNNRKPICRLWLNGGKKHIGLFDKNKVEDRFPLEKLEDIYGYEDRLFETVSYYQEMS